MEIVSLQIHCNELTITFVIFLFINFETTSISALKQLYKRQCSVNGETIY